MERIRLMLVDDDPEWLKAMTRFLNKEQDLHMAGAALNQEEALALVKTMTIDVVMMDINLTENKFDGLALAIEICQIQPTKVIVLTSFNEEDLIKKAFYAGAVNYISKTKFRELPQAIRSCYQRDSPFEVLVKEYTRLKMEEQLLLLTPAERDIFRLVEQGYTHTQIEKKYKTESTIKNQINGMLKKLGVHSMKEAIEKIRKEDL